MSDESLSLAAPVPPGLHSEASESQPHTKVAKRKAVTNGSTVAKVPKKAKPEKVVQIEGNNTPRNLVLDYMRQQNRPYNAQLVSDFDTFI